MSVLHLRVKTGSSPSEICACGTWLKHWEKFSEQTTQYCQVIGCLNRDVTGARVRVLDAGDDNWYVYPLCHEHCRSADELVIAENYLLVPADTKSTCARPSV